VYICKKPASQILGSFAPYRVSIIRPRPPVVRFTGDAYHHGDGPATLSAGPACIEDLRVNDRISTLVHCSSIVHAADRKKSAVCCRR